MPSSRAISLYCIHRFYSASTRLGVPSCVTEIDHSDRFLSLSYLYCKRLYVVPHWRTFFISIKTFPSTAFKRMWILMGAQLYSVKNSITDCWSRSRAHDKWHYCTTAPHRKLKLRSFRLDTRGYRMQVRTCFYTRTTTPLEVLVIRSSGVAFKNPNPILIPLRIFGRILF